MTKRIHYAWVIAVVVVLTLMASAGLRSTFGVFIKPLEQEFGWSRTTLSTVAAVSLFIYGASGPFAGRLADRIGPRGILTGSMLVLGLGSLLSGWVGSLWQLALTSGLLMAAGAGGASVSVASSLAARWFESRRGLVLGLAGGGMSAGQLLIIPLAMTLTVHGGWRNGFTVLGLLALLLVPLIFWLVRNDPEDKGLRPYGVSAGSAARQPMALEARTSLTEAKSDPAFWLLAGSFFVCGYTSTGLVMTHLIPHSVEHGFGEMAAAQALGIMGAVNIVGTVASGWICDRFGRKGPLAFYYFFRGVSLVFLIFVQTLPQLRLFAVIFGLNYISTVPPTSTLTAQLFGRRSVGEIFGWIFLSHQVGAALGSYLGGLFFDLTGGYTLAFLSAAILAFIATGLVLAIVERPRAATPATVPAS
jgi:MFS family permease